MNVVKLGGTQDKAWISPSGVCHVGSYHTEIAEGLFPCSENPEYSCERAGYLKVYITMSAIRCMFTGCETQDQINAVDRLTEKYYECC